MKTKTQTQSEEKAPTVVERLEQAINANCDLKHKSLKLKKGRLDFAVSGGEMAGHRAVKNLEAAGLQLAKNKDDEIDYSVKSNGSGTTKCQVKLLGEVPVFQDPPAEDEPGDDAQDEEE